MIAGFKEEKVVQNHRHISKSIVFVLWAALLTPTALIHAQDDALPAANAGDSEKQLSELLSRRTQILNRLAALRQAYQEADAPTQQKIETEYNQLIDELRAKSELAVTVAEKVHAANPAHVQAGETLVQNYYSLNQYDKAAKVGQALIDAGKASPIVLNLTGASYFATQEFGKAKETLTQASEVGGPIFQQVGGLYLQSCDEYQQYWETEKQIRAKETEADDLPRVLLKTSQGDIVLELFENEAPNTVANFISLVEKKAYDKTAFHRVIPNFMAQGGDPNTLDDDPENDGQGGPGYRIPCECYQPNARLHFQGSLSMAHAGKDTGGSQFFITHLPTSHLNPKQRGALGPSGHTVFGRVIQGLDVALALEPGDKIESATVLRKRNHPYEPKKL